MSTLELKVYDILKSRFSEKEASDVIEYVQTKVKETGEEKMVHSQILQNKELEIVRKEMATKEDIAALKSELLKWTVGMFIPLYLTIVGLIITLLLKH